MAAVVTVPELGQSRRPSAIAEWYLTDGQFVEPGDLIYRLECDFVAIDIEAEAAGVLRHRLAAGGVLSGGETAAFIFAEGEMDPVPLPSARLRLVVHEEPAAVEAERSESPWTAPAESELGDQGDAGTWDLTPVESIRFKDDWPGGEPPETAIRPVIAFATAPAAPAVGPEAPPPFLTERAPDEFVLRELQAEVLAAPMHHGSPVETESALGQFVALDDQPWEAEAAFAPSAEADATPSTTVEEKAPMASLIDEGAADIEQEFAASLAVEAAELDDAEAFTDTNEFLLEVDQPVAYVTEAPSAVEPSSSDQEAVEVAAEASSVEASEAAVEMERAPAVLPRSERLTIKSAVQLAEVRSEKLSLKATVHLSEVHKLCAGLTKEWRGSAVSPSVEDVVIRAAARAAAELGLFEPPIAGLLTADDRAPVAAYLAGAGRGPFREAVAALAATRGAQDVPPVSFFLISLAAFGIDEGTVPVDDAEAFGLSLGATRDGPDPMVALTMSYRPSALSIAEAAVLLGRVRDLIEAPYLLLTD